MTGTVVAAWVCAAWALGFVVGVGHRSVIQFFESAT